MFEYGLFRDIPNEDYHNYQKHPAISSSMLKTMLNKTAKHAKAGIDGLLNKKSRAMDFGSISHSIILNNEVGDIVIQPTDIKVRHGYKWDMFKNMHPGRPIATREEIVKIMGMFKEIQVNTTANAILMNATGREISGFWKSEHHSFDNKLRADIVDHDLKIISDYKTTMDASEVGFSKSFYSFDYDMSAAHYIDGMKMITGDNYEFVIIAQEKEPPFAIQCFRVLPEVLEIGRTKNTLASMMYDKCFENDEWPGYKEMGHIIPFAWAKAEADSIKEQIRNDEKLQQKQTLEVV